MERRVSASRRDLRPTRVWACLRSFAAQQALILAAGLAVLVAITLSGCGATVTVRTSGGSSGNTNTTGGATPSPTDSGTWVTVSKSSGSSVSSGGGTNSNTSTQSTSIGGAYRVMAACQGGGSLELQLNPGGGINIQCTASQQTPVRVAGGDSAPSHGTLSITIISHGNITWSDVEVQVRQ